VRVESIPVPGDLPVFVLRGGRGNKRMVFLHGHCSHGLGYVQSFQRAAARHGTVVAVQGNKACANGNFREWTDTPERLDRRIQSAFQAVGDPGPLTGLAVLGYSSGAVLAEMLAHKAPERYAYVVLIGGPKKPAEWRLRRTRSSVTLAGERDRQDLMQLGARDLHTSGIPSAFFVLPGARHGQMGPDAEPVMARALDWLWDNERSL
jgi:pimeloyl-ACP methyl ester carboxylesterase